MLSSKIIKYFLKFKRFRFFISLQLVDYIFISIIVIYEVICYISILNTRTFNVLVSFDMNLLMMQIQVLRILNNSPLRSLHLIVNF